VTTDQHACGTTGRLDEHDGTVELGRREFYRSPANMISSRGALTPASTTIQ
jgi:hypothetical protein